MLGILKSLFLFSGSLGRWQWLGLAAGLLAIHIGLLAYLVFATEPIFDRVYEETGSNRTANEAVHQFAVPYLILFSAIFSILNASLISSRLKRTGVPFIGSVFISLLLTIPLYFFGSSTPFVFQTTPEPFLLLALFYCFVFYDNTPESERPKVDADGWAGQSLELPSGVAFFSPLAPKNRNASYFPEEWQYNYYPQLSGKTVLSAQRSTDQFDEILFAKRQDYARRSKSPFHQIVITNLGYAIVNGTVHKLDEINGFAPRHQQGDAYMVTMDLGGINEETFYVEHFGPNNSRPSFQAGDADRISKILNKSLQHRMNQYVEAAAREKMGTMKQARTAEDEPSTDDRKPQAPDAIS